MTLGERLLSWEASNRIALFNMATANAWLENEDQFRVLAARFKANGNQGENDFWNRVVVDEAEWFAARLDQDPVDVESAFQSTDSPLNGGEL